VPSHGDTHWPCGLADPCAISAALSGRQAVRDWASSLRASATALVYFVLPHELADAEHTLTQALQESDAGAQARVLRGDIFHLQSQHHTTAPYVGDARYKPATVVYIAHAPLPTTAAWNPNRAVVYEASWRFKAHEGAARAALGPSIEDALRAKYKTGAVGRAYALPLPATAPVAAEGVSHVRPTDRGTRRPTGARMIFRTLRRRAPILRSSVRCRQTSTTTPGQTASMATASRRSGSCGRRTGPSSTRTRSWRPSSPHRLGLSRSSSTPTSLARRPPV